MNIEDTLAHLHTDEHEQTIIWCEKTKIVIAYFYIKRFI